MAEEKSKVVVPVGTTITGCNFVGIEKSAVERLATASEAIAKSCQQNAVALEKAAEVLRQSIPTIGAMVSIGSEE